jgi:hypothetical protein
MEKSWNLQKRWDPLLDDGSWSRCCRLVNRSRGNKYAGPWDVATGSRSCVKSVPNHG